MKPLLALASVGLAANLAAAPQHPDSTGLPGDGFSLRGALELFRQSADLAAFEQALNTEANGISNLDLNGDGQVDFIRVRTHGDGDARVVALQAVLAKDDAQDIAAIQMERVGEESVALQIRGDEALYPEGTIVEPVEAVKEAGEKRGGPLAQAAQVTVWVNVWMWPCVQWCYGPLWWEWSTPWYWGYYPPWWRPWRPWGWSVWWGYSRPYWGWYHYAPVCRVERAHNLYMHRRSLSPSWQQRHAAQPAPRREAAPAPGKPQRWEGKSPGGERERARPARRPAPPARPPEHKPARPSAPPPARPAPAPRPQPKAPGGGGRR